MWYPVIFRLFFILYIDHSKFSKVEISLHNVSGVFLPHIDAMKAQPRNERIPNNEIGSSISLISPVHTGHDLWHVSCCVLSFNKTDSFSSSACQQLLPNTRNFTTWNNRCVSNTCCSLTVKTESFLPSSR